MITENRRENEPREGQTKKKQIPEKKSWFLNVRVQPGAQKTEVKGLMPDGSVKVRLKAAPVEGKANAELVRFLARFFGVPASSVRIVRGMTSKQKSVVIEGMSKAGATQIMKLTLESGSDERF